MGSSRISRGRPSICRPRRPIAPSSIRPSPSPGPLVDARLAIERERGDEPAERREAQPVARRRLVARPLDQERRDRQRRASERRGEAVGEREPRRAHGGRHDVGQRHHHRAVVAPYRNDSHSRASSIEPNVGCQTSHASTGYAVSSVSAENTSSTAAARPGPTAPPSPAAR